MLYKFQLLQGALFPIFKDINLMENLMFPSPFSWWQVQCFLGVPKMETIPNQESISLFFHLRTMLVFTAVTKEGSILCQERWYYCFWKRCIWTNQNRIKEAWESQRQFQFHYSIFSLSFWQCFMVFSKKLGKQQGCWCLVKKKNLAAPQSKGWIASKMNPWSLNIRNKRVS